MFGERPSRTVRAAMIAAIVAAAVGSSAWRSFLGLSAIPGLFTVVFVPLAIVFFVVVDLRARFSFGEWLGVTALLVVHLTFSVPRKPKPLYYVGSHLFRPDHLVHLLAGALVAILCLTLLSRTRPDAAPITRVALALVMALAFGGMKELTDYLSTRASHLRHDTFDTVADICLNAVGAFLALSVRARSRHRDST